MVGGDADPASSHAVQHTAHERRKLVAVNRLVAQPNTHDQHAPGPASASAGQAARTVAGTAGAAPLDQDVPDLRRQQLRQRRARLVRVAQQRGRRQVRGRQQRRRRARGASRRERRGQRQGRLVWSVQFQHL